MPANRDDGKRLWETAAAWCAVLIFVFALDMVRGRIGLVWDEPPHFARHFAVSHWLKTAFMDPVGAFEPATLGKGWPFCREAPDEHPPFSAVVRVLCWGLAENLVDPITAHRLGTLAFFGLAVATVYRIAAIRWGRFAAAVGACALALHPRFFAHGRFADMDMPVAAMTIVTAAVFLRSCETSRRYWLFGVLLGVANMSKATGVLVWPAMLIWTLLYRVKNGVRCLLWSLVLTPATMVVLNPGWWWNPASGIRRWVHAMLDYPQKIPLYYFGTVYDAKETFPPWHNPWAMIGVTTPLGLLVPGALGLGLWAITLIRRREPARDESPTLLADSAVAGWAATLFLLPVALRMASILPIHDGVRQLIMVFPSLAVLAAYAVHRLQTGRTSAIRWTVRTAAAVGVLSAAVELVTVHPYELSYYNQLVGGAKGAERVGLDATYYWDAVNQPTLDWMNKNLPRDATVLIFPPPDVRVFDWYQRWGLLRSDLKVLNLHDGPPMDHLSLMAVRSDYFLIFLRRQGHFIPSREGISPFMTELSVAPARYEVRPPQLGVRLAAIFGQKEFAAFAEQFSSKQR